MQVAIREFREEDIPYKVRWINDPDNNCYLHYDLPLTTVGTTHWYHRIKNAPDRKDYTITADFVPCGVIGLLHLDPFCCSAEFYITVGEKPLKRKGIAFTASKLLLAHAFCSLNIKNIYLYTEPDNIPAKNLFRKLGFQESLELINGVYPDGRPACRFEIQNRNQFSERRLNDGNAYNISWL